MIIAVALIAAVACQDGGWVRGPDGYKYFTPEERMELPRNLQRIYLPPSNTPIELSNDPVGVLQFAPFGVVSLADIEATTFEYEFVQ
jgi:hypothetical protein